MQRLIDIGSNLKYNRNDFCDFIYSIVPIKCKFAIYFSYNFFLILLFIFSINQPTNRRKRK